MYGAVPYLMRSFALDRETAFRVICDWVDQQMENAIEPSEARRRKPGRRRVA